MSWDVVLEDADGGRVEVERHTEGGIHAVGGTAYAELNITFNYAYFYYHEIDPIDGLRWLDDKQAIETLEVLREAVATLGETPHPDCQNYWCGSTGRAGKALSTLLEWAEANPEATWRVSG